MINVFINWMNCRQYFIFFNFFLTALSWHCHRDGAFFAGIVCMWERLCGWVNLFGAFALRDSTKNDSCEGNKNMPMHTTTATTTSKIRIFSVISLLSFSLFGCTHKYNSNKLTQYETITTQENIVEKIMTKTTRIVGCCVCVFVFFISSSSLCWSSRFKCVSACGYVSL